MKQRTIYFLASADHNKPALSKTYRRGAEGELIKDNYPQVYRFTSHKYNIGNLDHFRELIEEHGKQGHCLSKGRLIRDLHQEPRKGATNTNDLTWWICLDIDGVDIPTHQAFVYQCLPTELHDVSYIWQPSASYLIDGDTQLRGHIIMMLENPVRAPDLKKWLKHINLSNPVLKDSLQLTASKLGLQWKLDISTCQNDKLIFISPPICQKGVKEPTLERYESVRKAHETATPNVPLTDTQTLEDEAIAALRKAMYLPPKKAKFKNELGHYILDNPDKSRITEWKDDGNYIRVNIEGEHASWGYYFVKNNPTLLHNHKNQPPMRLKDIDPEFYASVEEQFGLTVIPSHFVINNVINDKYGMVAYSPADRKFEIHHTGHEKKAIAFLEDAGAFVPTHIPNWKIIFDPQDPEVVNFKNRYLNRYEMSDWLRKAQSSPPVTHCPRVFYKILHHVMKGDAYVIDHFVNWLAFIIQRSEMTRTAWLFSGTEGTGKGVLFKKVIRPLLTEKHSGRYTIENLAENFNGWAEDKMLVIIDESEIDNTPTGRKIRNKLWGLIADDSLPLRLMRTDIKDCKSYLNFIFNTNLEDSIPISEKDRRFNIAPRQEEPYPISDTYQDFDIDLPNELQNIANYLMHFPVDEKRVRETLKNEERSKLAAITENSSDAVFKAIKRGNLEYFLEHVTGSPSPKRRDEFNAFHETVKRWVQRGVSKCGIERGDIEKVYRYLASDVAPGKFKKMLDIQGIKCKTVHLSQKEGSGYGIKVDWDYDQAQANRFFTETRLQVIK